MQRKSFRKIWLLFVNYEIFLELTGFNGHFRNKAVGHVYILLHQRKFSQTIEHGNSKNEITYRNRRRATQWHDNMELPTRCIKGQRILFSVQKQYTGLLSLKILVVFEFQIHLLFFKYNSSTIIKYDCICNFCCIFNFTSQYCI